MTALHPRFHSTVTRAANRPWRPEPAEADESGSRTRGRIVSPRAGAVIRSPERSGTRFRETLSRLPARAACPNASWPVPAFPSAVPRTRPRPDASPAPPPLSARSLPRGCAPLATLPDAVVRNSRGMSGTPEPLSSPRSGEPQALLARAFALRVAPVARLPSRRGERPGSRAGRAAI